MILKRRVSLNGAQLDEVDSRILIQGVEEPPAKYSVTAVSRAGGIGQRMTGNHRDTLDIKVKFSVLCRKYEMQAREEVFEAVAAWCQEAGWLRLNYRENRKIYVTCVELAAVGDPWQWTNEYTITFRAYGVPCWVTDSAVTGSTGTTTSGGCAVEVPGNMTTCADVVVANKSEKTIQTITVTAGASTFYFTNLALEGDESLFIDHTADGILRIRAGKKASSARSVMAKRTSVSADDLYVDPGNVSFSFTAQRACKMTVSCCGRFL